MERTSAKFFSYWLTLDSKQFIYRELLLAKTLNTLRNIMYVDDVTSLCLRKPRWEFYYPNTCLVDSSETLWCSNCTGEWNVKLFNSWIVQGVTCLNHFSILLFNSRASYCLKHCGSNAFISWFRSVYGVLIALDTCWKRQKGSSRPFRTSQSVVS